MDNRPQRRNPLTIPILLCLCIGGISLHIYSPGFEPTSLMANFGEPVAGQEPAEPENDPDHPDESLVLPRLRTVSEASHLTVDGMTAAFGQKSHKTTPQLPPPKLINFS